MGICAAITVMSGLGTLLHEGGMDSMRYPIGAAFVIASLVVPAYAADDPTRIAPPKSQSSKEIAPSELKVAPVPPGPPEPKKKESTRPPVKPAPAEARTPEEAAARAADPKDPSGALIIQKPAGTGAKP